MKESFRSKLYASLAIPEPQLSPQGHLWEMTELHTTQVTIPKRANAAGVIYVKDGKIMFAEQSSDDGVLVNDVAIESWYDLHKAVTKSLLRR